MNPYIICGALLLLQLLYFNLQIGLIVLGVIVICALYAWRSFRQFRKGMFDPRQKGQEDRRKKEHEERKDGTVYLHVPSLRPWGYPNASPYSCKLETFLRMIGIPFVIIPSAIGEGPSGKVPWIDYNGKTYYDSQIIMEMLSETVPQWDSHLTSEQRGISVAINRMVSEHTIGPLGYWRNLKCIKETLLAYLYDKTAFTFPINVLLPLFISSVTQKRLKMKGLLDHPHETIIKIGCTDLQALSDIIGTKKYLFGDTPCSADAAVFGILSSTLWIPIETPLKSHVYKNKNLHNLHNYLNTIRVNFYKDTGKWYCGGQVAIDAGFTGYVE